jgi:hypothetical protein
MVARTERPAADGDEQPVAVGPAQQPQQRVHGLRVGPVKVVEPDQHRPPARHEVEPFPQRLGRDQRRRLTAVRRPRRIHVPLCERAERNSLELQPVGRQHGELRYLRAQLVQQRRLAHAGLALDEENRRRTTASPLGRGRERLPLVVIPQQHRVTSRPAPAPRQPPFEA